jgi:hypothetical protein
MLSKLESPALFGKGWRLGVLLSFLSALAILVFNVVLTGWSSSTYPVQDGVGTAFTGSCHVVDTWSLGLRLLINILGTILLAASNYSMQCLSSPTRKNLDTAHANGRWMDVGIPGVRNLWHIQWYRTALWCGLIITSVPVHLLYNATIFRSLETEIYGVVMTNPAFLDTPLHNRNILTGAEANDTKAIEQIQTAYMSDENSFQRLDNADCIHAYAQSTISGYSDVVLITNYSTPSSTPIVFYYSLVNSFERDQLPFAWICQESQSGSLASNPVFCNAPAIEQHASEWTVEGKKIDYCLSRKIDEHCKLQFSTYAMGAVIACNGVKTICMLLTLLLHTEDIIVTLGDAISSYLKKGDPLTADKCLLEASDLRDLVKDKRNYSLPTRVLRAATWTRRRWGAAVSRERWIVAAITFIGVLIIDASFLVDSAVRVAAKQGSSNILWTIGFGAVDSRALIPGVLAGQEISDLVPAALVANLPQLLLSVAFVTYNGLWTGMLLAHEWHTFSTHRQPLRVSVPEGSQLATRWLTLPYRFSIPLLAFSSAMVSANLSRKAT